MKKKIIIGMFLSLSSVANCVHEEVVPGIELLANYKKYNRNYLVKDSKERFIKLNELRQINPAMNYQLQLSELDNKSYIGSIKYYNYSRIIKYIKSTKPLLSKSGYRVQEIGKSVKGKTLFSIYPNNFDPNKKTILMFGRHHGDESSANWIIEGFLNSFLKSKQARDRFQLVLYPMVNPDGTTRKTRYNANKRDLNRVWSKNVNESWDEVKTIQMHLLKNFLNSNKPIIALDMHGSIKKDFIYRVYPDFKGKEFYNHQQDFVDELSSLDQWQAGHAIDSNGDENMARIYLVRDFSVNAITHETRKKIPRSTGRSIQTLMEQGEAVLSSIMSLYY